jgi:hypothetical protein
MGHTGRTSRYRQDTLHAPVVETLEEHALADHPCRAEDHDVHRYSQICSSVRRCVGGPKNAIALAAISMLTAMKANTPGLP